MSGEAPLEKKLGQAIAAARKSAGLTQQQLCAMAGLSFSTLAKIERGAIASPSVFTVQKIATLTHTSVERLLGVASPAPVNVDKRLSKSGVSFVYFDIYGTLVRFFHQAFSTLSEDSGVSADLIETAFWHYNDAVCRGDMSLEDFDKTLGEKLGISALKWEKYHFETLQAIPEMQECVAWASQHYRVGLLSNIMPGFIGHMMSRHLLPALHFDAIIDSSKVGAIKPEPKIYEVAASLAGVEPSQILLVDNERANLMGAEQLGWHVLWFDDLHPSDSIERIKSALEY